MTSVGMLVCCCCWAIVVVLYRRDVLVCTSWGKATDQIVVEIRGVVDVVVVLFGAGGRSVV